MKNILFIGLGSIGQRHLRNSKKIFKNSNFFALRKTNHRNVIDSAKLKKKQDLEIFYSLKKVFKKLKDIKFNPYITFICNPTSYHIDYAIKFASKGSHIFIEKPIGINKSKINKLKKIIRRKKIVSFVGYQFRFHPAIIFLKEILDTSKFGKIINGNFSFLTFLPNHHKYENYKKTYVALKKLGGGTALNLSHDIDLIIFLFGKPNKINCKTHNPKIIKTETEKDLFAEFFYKNKTKITLNLSYSSFIEKREINLEFEKASINIDLNKNKLILKHNKKRIIKNYKINRNELFNKELSYFKKSIEKKRVNNFLSVLKHDHVVNVINKLNNC